MLIQEPDFANFSETTYNIPFDTGQYAPLWLKGNNLSLDKEVRKYWLKKCVLSCFMVSISTLIKNHGRMSLGSGKNIWDVMKGNIGIKCKVANKCWGKILIYNIFGQLNNPAIIYSNGYDTFYGRILHAALILNLQNLGIPKSTNRTYGKTIKQFFRNICTAFGY